MTGLTIAGLKDRILKYDYTLTESEAIDLFFLFPDSVEIEWQKKNMKSVKLNGLNLDFSIRA